MAIELTRVEEFALITLNRPEARNAVNAALAQGLEAEGRLRPVMHHLEYAIEARPLARRLEPVGTPDAVAARHPQIEFVKAPYLNDHPQVIATFEERLDQILTGDIAMNCQMCKYRTQVLGFEAEVGPYDAIVDGDALVYSIACASVVAKTVRDRLMARLSIRYPGYGWERNQGYATKEHRAAIRELGLTPFHRRSFLALQRTLAGEQPELGLLESVAAVPRPE